MGSNNAALQAAFSGVTAVSAIGGAGATSSSSLSSSSILGGAIGGAIGALILIGIAAFVARRNCGAQAKAPISSDGPAPASNQLVIRSPLHTQQQHKAGMLHATAAESDATVVEAALAPVQLAGSAPIPAPAGPQLESDEPIVRRSNAKAQRAQASRPRPSPSKGATEIRRPSQFN